MNVRINAFLHICIYVYILLCASSIIHTCICAIMDVCICVFVQLYICVIMCVSIYALLFANKQRIYTHFYSVSSIVACSHWMSHKTLSIETLELLNFAPSALKQNIRNLKNENLRYAEKLRFLCYRRTTARCVFG